MPDHVFNPREFIGIRAGYRDLFGGTTTWGELEQDLLHYTLAEVLDVLGRIGAVLKQGHVDDKQTQTQIAVGLFKERAPAVIDRANKLAAKSGNPRVVLFEPLQVASLAKASLLLLPAEGGLGGTNDYSHLATALLRMTDLIGPADLGEIRTDEDRRRWALFLFATGIFYRGGSDLHDLARFHVLCLQPHPELASHPDYLDLPGLVAAATGLRTDLMWLGLTAVQSQWLSLDANRAAAGATFIDEDRFLSANFHFSQEEQDRILAILCRDSTELQRLVREHYRKDDFKPFDLVPLADKPLV